MKPYSKWKFNKTSPKLESQWSKGLTEPILNFLLFRTFYIYWSRLCTKFLFYCNFFRQKIGLQNILFYLLHRKRADLYSKIAIFSLLGMSPHNNAHPCPMFYCDLWYIRNNISRNKMLENAGTWSYLKFKIGVNGSVCLQTQLIFGNNKVKNWLFFKKSTIFEKFSSFPFQWVALGLCSLTIVEVMNFRKKDFHNVKNTRLLTNFYFHEKYAQNQIPWLPDDSFGSK